MKNKNTTEKDQRSHRPQVHEADERVRNERPVKGEQPRKTTEDAPTPDSTVGGL